MRKGIAHIIIILIVALLLIGGLVYYALKPRPHVASNVSTPTVASVTPSPIDPYSDWKDFQISTEGLQGKYPADWKYTTKTTKYEYDPTSPVESLQFQGPDNFLVTIGTGAQGLGGGCDDSCSVSTVTGLVKNIEVPDYGKLSIIYTGTNNQSIFLRVLSNYTEGSLCYPNVCYGPKGKNHVSIFGAGYHTQVDTSGTTNYPFTWLNPEKFVQDANVQKAVLLFSSLKAQ